MIVSMTGFGDAVAEKDGTHYAVEIRSLNNRYFKATVKLPDIVSGLEPELETLLREKLGRGSVTYILKMRSDSAEAAYKINTQALGAYIDQLRSVIAADGNLKLDIGPMLTLPGVCQQPRDDTDELQLHGPVIRELTVKAIAKLNGMRKREGDVLHGDLVKNVKLIEGHLREIQKRAPLVIHEYHKRLLQRVNQLTQKAELNLDEQVLIKEVAVFAERADISEEIQRLGSHLAGFDTACGDAAQHSGRKLDFITQEMLREANTIASKANDADIGRRVVDIKGAIDRLKEQVQNVE